MILHTVHDKEFQPYGEVISGQYDFSHLLKVLTDTTDAPADGTIYVPSNPELEKETAAFDLRDHVFGGIDIQVGYCNGSNTALNCLECHRGIEVLVAADDIILMLAHKADVVDWKLDTEKIEAFLVPKGTAVLYYETTMHYAPAREEGPFRVIIALVRGTNTQRPRITAKGEDDKALFAKNKWLIAHPDSPEAKEQGAYVGLAGRNLDILTDLQR
ncbi:DUF4867 family protein [Bifidobacterium tibiigranuli]|uniref:DUF4867 family protein n=1 Tax=Bifidobacterium tibiigranuli TaxID=2172043 RepID=UPI0026EECF20|nr:DUF4867 family protein [Bifidobacterium tibiigranuli]MCI1650391.1 DUF4867 family protein [Bifidobacterium tibiigranuli]MCI2184933.1 DUF4867 family protein [Bifidobacterium tibiigranuli]MCI2204910.1 DUF4867 family protein [Bifidobacterium tibiigranuli]